MLELVEMIETG